VAVPPSPRVRYEVGYTCLRELVTQLAGDALGPAIEGATSGVLPAGVATGLGRIFRAQGGDKGSPGPGGARKLREPLVQTLAWAAGLASARARGTLVVALIDDLDVVDGISRAAIADAIESRAMPGVLFVVSCEAIPTRLVVGTVEAVAVAGLTRLEAKQLASGGRASAPPELKPRADSSGAQERRVEPLFLEHYLALRASSGDARPPATLHDMIAARAATLPRDATQVLLALAVVGGATQEELAHFAPRLEGTVEAAVTALVDNGFAVVSAGRVRIAHHLYADVALGAAPGGTVEDLQAAAAEALPADDAGVLELRAYHAVRARAGDEAVKLVEGTSRLRTSRGDDDGAIASLEAGFSATRRWAARGDWEGASWAFVRLGTQLAERLVAVGREGQAHGVAVEVLQALGPGARSRAPLLEILSRVASARGKHGEAARLMREAEIAVDEEDDSRASIRRIVADTKTGKRARPAALREERKTPPRSSTVIQQGRRVDSRVETDDDDDDAAGKT
jgi:hypothetical protein